MGLLWKCGVVVATSIVQSLGLTLQRLSHLEPPLCCPSTNEPNSPPNSGTPNSISSNKCNNLAYNQHSIMLWRIGIALFIFANLIGSTVQLAVLPLVIVCTLQAVGLVSNSVLAYLILKEPLTRSAIVGTILVVLGAVLVAGLGSTTMDPETSLDELFELFWSHRFVIWMSSTIICGILLVFYAHKVQLARDTWLSPNAHSSNICGWIWGFLGGVASAHSLLMAKLVVGLLVNDFPNILDDLVRAQFWIIGLAFLAFALSQMWYVNKGLQCTSTSVLYPLVFCVYNITTLINSVMLYGPDTFFEKGSATWVILGTIVLISGVMLLSKRFECGTEPTQPETLPQWQPHRSASRITMGTLASPSPITRSPSIRSANLASPVFHIPNSHSNHMRSTSRVSSVPTPPPSNNDMLSPVAESSLLLNGSTYTSFDAISPNISSPDKKRGRHGHRVLSKEQHRILRELGI